jgi:hypothetical protein
MWRRLAPLAAALVAAVAPSACGGGDDPEEVRATVREFVRATSERDADAFCGRLVTREFLEQVTGATGDDARDACRSQVRGLRRVEVELIRIEKVSIDGDRATATTLLQTRGRTQPQVFRLRKEDGDWRMSSGGGG